MVKALLISKLARLGCTAGAAASCTLARPTTASSSTRSHILAWTRYGRIDPLSSVVTYGHHYACGEPTTAWRQYVSRRQHRRSGQNHGFPRAKLARHVRYAVLLW